MTYYIKHGSKYSITNREDTDISEILPPGTYTVGYDGLRGVYFLETIESFKPISKIYGDSAEVADRILSTFDSRPYTTGVLLSGEKGSGKTLLAKLVSLKGIETGIPTIVINQAWHGEAFNRFIQEMEQPMVLLFDEFEKVYESENQEELLTLLDGTYPTKKLFVMTCNDRFSLSKYMFNRPGRFFYSIEYSGISEEFVREYCADKLHDLGQVEGIVRYYKTFKTFNFDMLQALVEEMNRYEESVQQALKYLNVSSDGETFAYTISELSINGIKVPTEAYDDRVSHGHTIALSHAISVYYDVSKLGDVKIPPRLVLSEGDEGTANNWDLTEDEDEDSDNTWKTAVFTFNMIKKYDGDSVTYVDEERNNKLVMEKKKYPKYDASNYIWD